MIIPWGTDAPIYHRPIATLAIMVLNVALYLLFPAGAARNGRWSSVTACTHSSG